MKALEDYERYKRCMESKERTSKAREEKDKSRTKGAPSGPDERNQTTTDILKRDHTMKGRRREEERKQIESQLFRRLQFCPIFLFFTAGASHSISKLCRRPLLPTANYCPQVLT
ncbi:hypothetical protein BDW75DRAFT_58200 [Aspergillus navahoensis]